MNEKRTLLGKQPWVPLPHTGHLCHMHEKHTTPLHSQHHSISLRMIYHLDTWYDMSTIPPVFLDIDIGNWYKRGFAAAG